MADEATEGLLAKRVQQALMIKEKLAKLEEAYEVSRKPLLDLKALLEGYFEAELTASGAQSVATPYGTVHWNHRVTAKVEDPEAFMEHVKATQDFDLMERRASPTAAQDYVKEHGCLPPGVKLNSIRTIGMNKPGAKVRSGK